MHTPSQINPTGQPVSEASSTTQPVQDALLEIEGKADTPRFLITLDVGIGDAVAVGLSVVDQIIENDPEAYGKIDVLCNPIQSQIFECDPRINRVVQTEKVFFPGSRVTQWLRGIALDAEAAKLISFLQRRQYEAVFPSVVAPGLYWRLHSRLMYPNLFKLVKDLLTLRTPSDLSLRGMVRQMVNRYFSKDISSSELTDELLLYIDGVHLDKAVTVLKQIKERSNVCAEDARVLLVAADSASTVSRPPFHLLAAALVDVLRSCDRLIVCILPGYTDAAAAENLERALASDFAGRVFLLSTEPKLTLLETAALIDQVDVFVTGDTGVMHLAAATKRIGRGEATPATSISPRNSVKIIVIFGGTNPDFYGYKERTMIVGKGRKEQRAFRPGFAKGMYIAGGEDLFDHISPQQLAEAIVSQV